MRLRYRFRFGEPQKLKEIFLLSNFWNTQKSSLFMCTVFPAKKDKWPLDPFDIPSLICSDFNSSTSMIFKQTNKD